MTALDRLLAGVIALALLLGGTTWAVRYYGAARYQAGYDAAVAAGNEAREAAATANLAIESGLRARLLDKDTEAYRKELDHAQDLADAQRRVRAGVDGLRCPAASAVHEAAAPGGGPAAARPTPDGGGPPMVPDVSADILGLVADHQRLVRRYDRLTERFEACRAVNAQ